MAVIHNFQSKFGVEVSYGKITGYSEIKENIQIAVSWFISEQARLNGSTPLETQHYSIPMYSEEYLNQQGMNHLKYCYLQLIRAYGFEGDEDVSQWLLPLEDEVQLPETNDDNI